MISERTASPIMVEDVLNTLGVGLVDVECSGPSLDTKD